MPHKKPRNIASLEEPVFELAPTEYNSQFKTSKKRKTTSDKRDDTPKEFLRLMSLASGKKKMNALDNGDQQKKKQKPNPQKKKIDTNNSNNKKAEGGDKDEKQPKEIQPTSNKYSNPVPYKAEIQTKQAGDLKIQPGESLQAFSRRVDQTLKVQLKSRTAHPSHLKKQKRRQQLLAEEAERRKKKEEEEESDNYDPEEVDPFEEVNAAKKKRNGRSPSPFAELRLKREAIKFGDDFKAPPELTKFKPKFKMVMDVPKASGSLAKREGLQEERLSIVEKYRQMMNEKRAKGIGSLVQ